MTTGTEQVFRVLPLRPVRHFGWQTISMISFGNWSTTLAIGLGFGLTVAVLLATSGRNRAANLLLAAFIAAISLKLAPYMLGFAGFYASFPWLSFAPLNFGLALGPLLWLHVFRLTVGRMPPRAWLHLAPVMLQAGYYVVLFPWPQERKDAFASAVDGPWVQPVMTWLALASFSLYLALAWSRYRRYQAWLDQTLSNREQFRLPWLKHLLWVLAIVLPCWIAFELASSLRAFDYYERYPLYLGLTLLVGFLGLEGWRHADLTYPLPGPGEESAPISAEPPAPGRDWSDPGRRWRDQLERSGGWRDPDLSLAALARHLGTNTHYLSRAFNEGLGKSFNEVVNEIRVRAVQAALQQPDAASDLMALALSVGFNSKSSFNRVFKAMTGVTPSEYRAAAARGRARS
jgi:AraC-like DNA-binding protein